MGPLRLLFARARYFKSVRLPRFEGMCPWKWFPLKSRYSRFTSIVNSSGTLPSIKFWLQAKTNNLVKFPSILGRIPMNLFTLRSTHCKFMGSPLNTEEIVPVSWLVPKSRTCKFVKFANRFGMDPLKLLFDKIKTCKLRVPKLHWNMAAKLVGASDKSQ